MVGPNLVARIRTINLIFYYKGTMTQSAKQSGVLNMAHGVDLESVRLPVTISHRPHVDTWTVRRKLRLNAPDQEVQGAGLAVLGSFPHYLRNIQIQTIWKLLGSFPHSRRSIEIQSAQVLNHANRGTCLGELCVSNLRLCQHRMFDKAPVRKDLPRTKNPVKIKGQPLWMSISLL